jgi:hypothetical protein
LKTIDSYSHVIPRAYFDRMAVITKDKGSIKRWLTIPVLYDLEARLKMMDEFPNYQQILTLSNLPIEMVAGPLESPELARLANEG